MVSYNIILNSQNKVAGTPNNDTKFYYDWTFLTDNEYKLTFTFNGSTINTSTLIPSIHIDLGQTNTYAVSSTMISGINSLSIGTLNTNGLLLTSSQVTNGSIYLSHRPTNSIFSVRILDPSGNPFLDSGSAIMNNYMLTLHLEKP